MSTWLFIGSGPSAPAGLAAARVQHQIHHTITCNAGIVLDPQPDYYFVWDVEAARAFRQAALMAQQAGTRLLTLDVPEWSRKANGVTFCDELLKVGSGDPTREQWGRFRGSGPCCMEYALRHGATKLLLVGCDGYQHDSPQDYFDGDRHVSRLYGRKMADSATRNDLQPRTQELVLLWPEIEFICYGNPCYRIGGGKWHTIAL